MGTHGRGMIVTPAGEVVYDAAAIMDRYVGPLPRVERDTVAVGALSATVALLSLVAATMPGVSGEAAMALPVSLCASAAGCLWLRDRVASVMRSVQLCALSG